MEPNDITGPTPIEVNADDGTVTIATPLGESVDGSNVAPCRIVTIADITAAAQLAWIRTRVEPRREHERWEAVVRAVLHQLGPVSRGEHAVDGEILSLLTGVSSS